MTNSNYRCNAPRIYNDPEKFKLTDIIEPKNPGFDEYIFLFQGFDNCDNTPVIKQSVLLRYPNIEDKNTLSKLLQDLVNKDSYYSTALSEILNNNCHLYQIDFKNTLYRIYTDVQLKSQIEKLQMSDQNPHKTRREENPGKTPMVPMK